MSATAVIEALPAEADPIRLPNAAGMRRPVPLRPATGPGSAPEEERRRRLRAAPTPAKRRGSPVLGAVIAVCVLLGIFAAQLALSILVSEGAYESAALEKEQRDLGRVERVLTQNLDKLASPQNLAENAAALGMVQNIAPSTLRLSDGAIQGTLQSTTKAASPNLVANSLLSTLPVLDAQGLLTSRNAAEAAAPEQTAAVRWQGKLPAPETH